MACYICNNKVYRKSMCKLCYKNDQKNHFHCTYNKCLSPVFAFTLCQLHYKMWKRPCLLCPKKMFCRNLCRHHYRQFLAKKLTVEQPTCKLCDKELYLNDLCVGHFKDMYNNCIIVGCTNKNHKKGLCCSHYFKLRRLAGRVG